MKIYFIRHAESTENSTQTYKGSTTSLSDKGKKQALQLASRFKKNKIDYIYTSTDKRAIETTKIISKVLGMNFKPLDNLRELINPTDVLKLPYNNPKAIKINKLIRNNFHKKNWKYSDEESFLEFRGRIITVLQKLMKYDKEGCVVCVTHRIVMKMILALAILGEKLNGKQFLDFREHIWLENTGISIFEYANKYGWSLLSWNDFNHLNSKTVTETIEIEDQGMKK